MMEEEQERAATDQTEKSPSAAPKRRPLPKFEWGSVACDSERCKRAVLSWLPLVPESWGLPLKADMQVEIETDRETAIRALFRLPDGRLKEAIRRMGKRSFTVTTRNASPGILKDADYVLAQGPSPSAGMSAAANPNLERP